MLKEWWQKLTSTKQATPDSYKHALVALANLEALYRDPSSNFQRDISNSQPDAMSSSAVYSCVQVLASDVAKLPLNHWRKQGDTRIPIDSSAVSRLIRTPNPYQTYPQWILDTMRALLLTGNAYSYAVYNGRNEVTELHPLPSASPYVAPDGSIFYSSSTFALAQNPSGLVPARYILHIRGMTLGNPLVGITPIRAAASSANAGFELAKQSQSFARNIARPSGVLSLDFAGRDVAPDVLTAIRQQFDAQFSGANVGKTAVVVGKSDYHQLTMSALDADIVRQMEWSAYDVARVFGVPPFRIGLGQMPAGSAETINRTYVSGILSFYLRLIETSLERFVEMPSSEMLEADLDAMLRADMGARFDAYAKGVQGGVLTPNDARAKEGERPLTGGDDLFLQRQMTPVSLLTELAAAEIKKAKEPALAPAAQEADHEDEIDSEELANAVARYLEAA